MSMIEAKLHLQPSFFGEKERASVEIGALTPSETEAAERKVVELLGDRP